MRDRGFTYVSLLLALAIAAAGLAAAAEWASTALKRERERDLLFAGEQFAQAIRSYQQRSQRLAPGRPPLATSLGQLLEDQRGVAPERHLRRLYVDPMTRSTDWGLVRDSNGGIVAVYSKSLDPPLRTADLPGALVSDGPHRRYADWKFGIAFEPAPVVTTAAAAQSALPFPTGTDAAPVAPVVEATAPPLPPVRAADLRNRSPQACERIEANDRRICTAMLQRFGRDAGEACTLSAQERALACQDRDNVWLPPLAVRQM